MTISIHISPELNDRLKEQARQVGIAPEQYAERLLQQHVPSANSPLATVMEFDGLLDEYFASHPRKTPPLPAEFSRDDIYSDHD